MADVEINYLAVLVAALASMAIGFAWFTIWARAWLAAVGKTREELQPNPLLYLASFVLALVMAFVLAYVVDWAQADNVGEGLLVGFLAWLGFVATTKAVSTLYEGRPRNLYLLDVGYHLVELLVMGVILALWD